MTSLIPDLAMWQWGLAALTAFIVSVAKCGVPGLGILAVPLMAHVFPARESVGMLLPVLVVADLFAVAEYRRDVDWTPLARMASWVVVGVVAAAIFLQATAGDADAAVAAQTKDWFRPFIGGLVLAILVLHVRAKLRATEDSDREPGKLTGPITGALAGWASTLANAAGPLMSMYLATLRMEKKTFVGTKAWFFLVLNIGKVPVLALVGMFKITGLGFALCLLPAVAVGSVSGLWILKAIPQRAFEWVVLVLIAASAMNLLIG